MTLNGPNQDRIPRRTALNNFSLKKIDGPNLVSLITADAPDDQRINEVPQEDRQYLLKHFLSRNRGVSMSLLQGLDNKVDVLHQVLDWICQDDSRIKELKNLISIAVQLGELKPLIEAMLKDSRYFDRSNSALSLLASKNEHSDVKSIITAARELGKLPDILNLRGCIMKSESKTVDGELLISSKRCRVGSQAVLKAAFIAGHTELAMYLLEIYQEANMLVEAVDSGALTLGVYHASQRVEDANIQLLHMIGRICTAVVEEPTAKSSLSGRELGDILKDESLAQRLVGATERVYNGIWHELRKTREGLPINPVIMGLEHANHNVLTVLARIAVTDQAASDLFIGTVATWAQAKYTLQQAATSQMTDLFQKIQEAVSDSAQINDQWLNQVGEYAWLIFISEHLPEANRLEVNNSSASLFEQIAWNSPAARELTTNITIFLDAVATGSRDSPARRVVDQLERSLQQTSDRAARNLLRLLVDSFTETTNHSVSAADITGHKSENAPATTELEAELTAVLEIFAHIEQYDPSNPIDCVSAAKKLSAIFDSKEDALRFMNRAHNWLLKEEAGITGWSHMIHDVCFNVGNHREYFDGIIRKMPVQALLNFEHPKGQFDRKKWAKLMMENPEVVFYIDQASAIESFAREKSIDFPDEVHQLRSLVNDFSLSQLGLRQVAAGMPEVEPPEAHTSEDLEIAVYLEMAIEPSLLPSIRNLTASGFFESTTLLAPPGILGSPGRMPVIKTEGAYQRISLTEANQREDVEYWTEFNIQSVLPNVSALDLHNLCLLLYQGGAIPGLLDKHVINFDISRLSSDVQFYLKKTLLVLAAESLPTETLVGNNYRNTLNGSGFIHREKVLNQPETPDELLAACRVANNAEELPRLAAESPIRFTDLDRPAEVNFHFQTSKVGLHELFQHAQETRSFMSRVIKFSEQVANQGAMIIPADLTQKAGDVFSRLRGGLDPDADTRIHAIDLF